MKKLIVLFLALTLFLPVFSGCDHAVSESLSAPEQQSKFPTEPPILSVSDGNNTVQAWRGTCSWMFVNQDGTGSGINTDSMHPLDCANSIQGIHITKKTTISLNFEATPTSVTVRRYKLNTSNYDQYEEIPVNGNTIEIKAGNYLYEVIAKWENKLNPYSGTVYYAFRTEK